MLQSLAPMAPSLYSAMAAPRRLGEPLEHYRARTAALQDITADLISEFTPDEVDTGGGDPWFESDPRDDPASQRLAA